MLNSTGLPEVQSINRIKSAVVSIVIKDPTVSDASRHDTVSMRPVPCLVSLPSGLFFVLRRTLVYPIGDKDEFGGFIYLSQDRYEQLQCGIEIIVAVCYRNDNGIGRFKDRHQPLRFHIARTIDENPSVLFFEDRQQLLNLALVVIIKDRIHLPWKFVIRARLFVSRSLPPMYPSLF